MTSMIRFVAPKDVRKEYGATPGIGDVVPFRAYRAGDTLASGSVSSNAETEGNDLYLVSSGPSDTALLVGVLRSPVPHGAATTWRSAEANTTPVTDVTALLNSLRLQHGEGVFGFDRHGLASALSYPVLLTRADRRSLEAAIAKSMRRTNTARPVAAKAKPKGSAPRTAKAKLAVKKKAAPKRNAAPPAAATATSRIAAIIEGRMEQAILAVGELTARATASVVPQILPWVGLDKWRSTEATSFWVYTYFLLMCFGGEKDAKVLRRPPGHRSHSEMHRSLLRMRSLVADVLELRKKPKQRRWTDEPLPKTRARVMDHIAKRLGDPRWKQGKELVALVAKPSFSLHGEEGLHVFAALLLHVEPDDLAPLKDLAKQEPILAQILAARGASTTSGDRGRGDRGELLRRSVLEDPTNDEPRAVYADWLLEQGDPRGEAIAAQLAGKPTTIDERSALAWAGGLRAKLRWRAPFANEKMFHAPRYTRGFLSGAAVDSLDGKAANSPDWATIEVLDVHGRNIDKIGDYDLRSLVVLGGLSEKNLDAVLDRPDLVARLIGIGVKPDPRGRGDLWDRLMALKRLRLLAVGGGSVVRSLLTHPLMRRLALLAVDEDEKLPKSVRDRVATVGTYAYGERWLPHHDLLMRQIRGPSGPVRMR